MHITSRFHSLPQALLLVLLFGCGGSAAPASDAAVGDTGVGDAASGEDGATDAEIDADTQPDAGPDADASTDASAATDAGAGADADASADADAGADASVPVDCEVGAWSAWSDCSATCGGGTQTQMRAIVTSPAGAGLPCPPLTQDRVCNDFPCG